MPIVSNDIHFRLSGGASNTDVNAALGGAKSSTSVGSGLHNLFDLVNSTEAGTGDTEYRCIYLHNNHGTLSMLTTKIWISSNTPSADSSIEIGLAAAAINATEAAVANETTAPAGVTFLTPLSEGAAISIGDIPAGQHKAIWIKRTIAAGAAAYASDAFTITVKCDTAA